MGVTVVNCSCLLELTACCAKARLLKIGLIFKKHVKQQNECKPKQENILLKRIRRISLADYARFLMLTKGSILVTTGCIKASCSGLRSGLDDVATHRSQNQDGIGSCKIKKIVRLSRLCYRLTDTQE